MSALINQNTIIPLIIIVSTFLMVYIIMRLSNIEKYQKIILNIRRMPALNAIEEAVGRATETNRPILFPTGIGALSGSVSPQQIAGLAVARYIAELSAKMGSQYIVTTGNSEFHSVMAPTIQEAYISAGKPELFRPDTVRFLSPYQTGYAAAVSGIIRRERPAAVIMVGAYYAETSTFLPTATLAGCIRIGGSARVAQMAVFAGLCDYLLIGEEIYAAASYITKNPKELSALAVADILKLVTILLLIIGIIERQVGGNAFFKVLGM